MEDGQARWQISQRVSSSAMEDVIEVLGVDLS